MKLHPSINAMIRVDLAVDSTLYNKDGWTPLRDRRSLVVQKNAMVPALLNMHPRPLQSVPVQRMLLPTLGRA